MDGQHGQGQHQEQRQQHQHQAGDQRLAPDRKRLDHLDRIGAVRRAARIEAIAARRRHALRRIVVEAIQIGIMRIDQHMTVAVAQKIGQVFIMRGGFRQAADLSRAVVVIVVMVVVIVIMPATAAPARVGLAAAIAVGLVFHDRER